MTSAARKEFARDARRQLISQVDTKLQVVLAIDSLARRENPTAVRLLEEDIARWGKTSLIERIAYTWFNRISALRFMDVNAYTGLGIVSPAPGQTQPEILAEAKKGHIDRQLPASVQKDVLDLLSGSRISANPQQEAYRLLFIAYCNIWHNSLGFLFEKLQDYSELLLPDDLLSEQSIVTKIQQVLTAEVCQDVEIIGWLYQYYISEKKEEVDKAIKRKKKVASSSIPAATQLFTPNWIVRYLLENSLGRLWMLNHPESKLVDKMDYYIKPSQLETDYLHARNPEEIRICDPACGSGHMLVYAFDLLYEIYREKGYDETGIPELILTNNLFGIEIDKRAGDLAAFALSMKARKRDRHFFKRNIQPNICVLNQIVFQPGELQRYKDHVGTDSLTSLTIKTLEQFKEADNFGSLIKPKMSEVRPVIVELTAKYSGPDLALDQTHSKVLTGLNQAQYLTSQYHIVVTNPPYLGSGNMNARLAEWLKENYPDTKSDLFAAFMERCINLSVSRGIIAMITMQSWMFLSSYKRFRSLMIENKTILSMIHLGTRAFDSISGEVVSTVGFVCQNRSDINFTGDYFRLIDGKSENQKREMFLRSLSQHDCGWFYRAIAEDFKKIPGNPIGYWASKRILKLFSNNRYVDSIARTAKGMVTANNDYFVREWYEVSANKIGHNQTRECSVRGDYKWYPYANGGVFRKWYGNFTSIVNWENDGDEIRTTRTADGSRVRATNLNLDRIFKEGLSWSAVTSGQQSFRFVPAGYLYDAAAGICQARNISNTQLISLFNTNISEHIFKILNPTLNLVPGNVASIPCPDSDFSYTERTAHELIEIAKTDWDSYEISWDFQKLPLLTAKTETGLIEDIYKHLRASWQCATDRMRRLEERNNFDFIRLFDLEQEFGSQVAPSEVTIKCNPRYRYEGEKSENELESLLLADTMREFISYAVGCMFGRYSLDKPGLILANQGDNLKVYLEKVPEPCYMPDENNVIPILKDNWFADDITARFIEFLGVTFGDDNISENLSYLESAINKDLRSYFLREFYDDHVKRYSKRPIYWLFSSPRRSFNALIYIHRYSPDTLSIILNKYLRELQVKFAAKLEQLRTIEADLGASQSAKTAASREIDKMLRDLDELTHWEREVIFPLAAQKIEIDLDDGVKANYPKFGRALRRIDGLSPK